MEKSCRNCGSSSVDAGDQTCRMCMASDAKKIGWSPKEEDPSGLSPGEPGAKLEERVKRYGHPMFYELLESMADLHSRKNHDYAGEGDSFRNFKACERIGEDPFKGVIIRLQDKWSRLESFMVQGKCLVANEGVEDTLMDNAVYSLIAIILRREAMRKGEGINE